ncbi:hypothetical protein [Actinoplanes sp. NPDC049118]|uniref:hypothetical protein n=1 Tax=Actinoplanes sp. NPDC049118 TaxID=3155769 RepID=UPI0033C5C6BF
MSVFRAANSTTAWPVSADPYDDGPTERLASADSDGPAEPPPRRGVVFAVLLAMLAMLVSAGSGLIAWRALGRADEAFRRSYTPAYVPVNTYTDQNLRIPAECGTTTFIDLDEPRVNVPGKTGDLRYQSWCEKEAAPRLALGPGAVAGSQPNDADVGEDGCTRAVRAGPLGGATTVPAKKGLVLCILTGPAIRRPAASPSGPSPSGTPASGGSPSTARSSPPGPDAGESPESAATSGSNPATPPGAGPAIDAGAGRTGVRMVRVEVTEVSSSGTANLRATSWAVR